MNNKIENIDHIFVICDKNEESNRFEDIKKWISLGIEFKVEKYLSSNSLELLLIVFEQLHVDIELKQKSKSLTSSSFLLISSG